MYTVHTTQEFDRWLSRMRDAKGKARIVARIRSAELGNLGDTAPVGNGISEMRVHYGPGYRVYFKRRGKVLILLLLGGSKATQARDIQKAKELAISIEE